MVLKWGICGAGHIGTDFKIGLDVHPGKHQVLAVASRSLEKAKTFAKTHKIERAYGCYEELANDKDVDIAFIAVITSQHYNVSKLFLEAGKHVVCEMPCSMNPEEVKELTQLAMEKSVFFMEDLMTMFTPAFRKAQELIESGALGDCTLISGVFAYNMLPKAEELSWALDKKQGGGSLGAASYLQMLADVAYDHQEPKDIKAFGRMTHDGGVDISTTAILDYGNGRLAQCATSLGVDLPSSLDIAGSKGWIRFTHPMWAPEGFTSSAGDFQQPHPKSESVAMESYPFATVFSFAAEEVRRCLEAGKLESDIATHALSIRLANNLHRGLSLIGYLE